MSIRISTVMYSIFQHLSINSGIGVFTKVDLYFIQIIVSNILQAIQNI